MKIGWLLVDSIVPFSFFLCSVATAQGAVHVVDRSGAPGTEYLSIHEAVEAATEGDIVLVRDGIYPGAGDGIALVGKGLAVVAERQASVTTGTLLCTDLPAASHVLVQGVRFVNNVTTGILQDNSGPLWLERAMFLPGLFVNPPPFTAGLEVEACEALVLSRSEVRSVPTGIGAQPWALLARDSRLHLFSTRVLGEAAFRDDLVSLVLERSLLWLLGSTVQGADGVDGSLFQPQANEGGDGLELRTGSEARIVASLVTGGPGGTPYPSGPTEPDGQAFVGPGTVRARSGGAKELELTSPAREGQTIDLVLRGRPGDQAWVWAAGTPSRGLALSGVRGEFLLPSNAALVWQATLPASGSAQLSFPAPTLPTGIEGAVYFVQAAVLDVDVSRFVLSTPSAVVVLDSSL
jgi:hypothetical protein